MIMTQGGRFGGYGFYVLEGQAGVPVEPRRPGAGAWEGAGGARARQAHARVRLHTTTGSGAGTLAFNSLSGIGRGGTGVLKVDGKEVAPQTMERTLPFILQWDENFDVGADTGTPVDDADYQVPFRFAGTLGKLTLSIDRPQLSDADKQRLMAAEHDHKSSE